MRRIRLIRARLPRLTAGSVGLVAVLTALLVALPLVAWAQFPISEPFDTSTTNNPDWVLGGTARLTNQGDGWLELTPASGAKMGSAILNDPFPSDYGITVQFQYASFGGTSPGGDGFSFFLMDGSSPPSVGASGAGLGYASNYTGQPGVVGGYVGVGFDEFGNFSSGFETGSASGPGRRPQNIVVRGTTAARWPFLAGEPAPDGTLETGNNTTGVRTVRITIIDNSAGLPLLSVFSNAADHTALQPVITDLELNAPLPPTFKLGFAAGTGGQTNIHEIRDLTVGVPADLSIVKQGPLQVTPGGQIQYTLLVNGNGPTSVTNAVVQDIVPADVTGVTWRCVSGPGGFCVAPSPATGNNVTARVSFPNPGGVGSVQIVITGTVARSTADGTVITNTATVTLPADRLLAGPSDNSSTETTEVEGTAEAGSADLSIDKTVDNAHPLLGQDVTFAVTVTNNGPDPTTETLVRDQLPAGLDYVSDDAATTGGSYEPEGGVWDAGPLAVGQSKTLDITASAQAAATNVVTFAESELPDPTPCPDACGPAVTVTPVFAHLELTKTATPETTAPGGLVSYHLSVTNTGDAPAADVTLTDKLPPEVSYLSDDSGGSYHPATGSWNVGDLAVGATRRLNITVRANATSINAIVQAVSDLPDPDPCLALPSLPPPQVTMPYGCPPAVTVTVTAPIVPVTG